MTSVNTAFVSALWTEVFLIKRIAIGAALFPLITIIHESGHAIAYHLLIKNGQHKIKLDGYGYLGGTCIWKRNRLSKLGSLLGHSKVYGVIAAAGPVVEMAASLALLRFFPGNGVSLVNLANNAICAVSALNKQAYHTERLKDLKIGDDHVQVKIYNGKLASRILTIICVASALFAAYLSFVECIAEAKG